MILSEFALHFTGDWSIYLFAKKTVHSVPWFCFRFNTNAEREYINLELWKKTMLFAIQCIQACIYLFINILARHVFLCKIFSKYKKNQKIFLLLFFHLWQSQHD